MMIHHFVLGRRRAGLTLVTAASLAAAGFAATTSYASSGTPTASSHVGPRTSGGGAVHDNFVDVTSQTGPAVTRALRGSVGVTRSAAVRAALAGAPSSTVLEISGTTHTVRYLANLDGYLTGRSTASPKSIALGYVRSHPDQVGLDKQDLRTLHLQRDYRDIDGTHHLFFTQTIDGKPVAHNGLEASVSKRGHLLMLGGMPITQQKSAAVVPAPAAETITTAAQALARTRGPVAPGSNTSTDTATRVLFDTGTGLRPAWETVVTSSLTPATTVIDAVTGRILMRTPMTDYADSTARVYRLYPGAPRGGSQVFIDFTKHGWLSSHAHILKGNNAHAFSDVNDNNRPSASEEVHALKGQSWAYKLVHFKLPWAQSFCNRLPCSWNPDKAFSWKVNRAQNATQVFYFVNNWHDHLLAKPIGFDAAAGNFQVSNHGQGGKGGDPVSVQTDDGADTGRGNLAGLPNSAHVDNANMSTPPDGHSPTMQMYLQHTPHTSYPAGDPWSPTNVGDEADTVYHEYTHGLSNRLNVDVRGVSTLGTLQAGAMGEAWSDWYAVDYLVGHHLETDVPGKPDVRLFRYDGAGVDFDRTEPMDCKVGEDVRTCNGGETGHRGGYTYADYGKVVGSPEVHADGEIWSQTLWDLRSKLGSKTTESLVTRAMELAPYNPSFLDMRNAILVADNAVFGGAHLHKIWQVFAHRGMGFYAGSFDGNDTHPAASTAMPPTSVSTGTISGTVLDQDSHAPVAGVTVSLAFQGSGPVNPTAVTNSSGQYTFTTAVPNGHYGKIEVRGKGYVQDKSVTVSGDTTVDFSPRLDYAAASTGAVVTKAGGHDYSSIGCGPDGAIDGSQATGWSTNAVSSTQPGTFAPKSLTVRLARKIDVTGFAVDPGSTCGDDSTSSTAGYTIQTSPTGAAGTWTTAATATFTSADDGHLVAVPASETGVQFVRFTGTSDQVAHFSTACAGGGSVSGCQFVDMSELQAFGVPSP